MSELRFPVPEAATEVSAIVEIPSGAHALLVLAHGAGAGMRHPAMAALARALAGEGVGTFRYQFPYMEAGSKRPDRPPVAVATVAGAVTKARELSPLPLFAGGKSFGGRMTTTAAAEGKIPEVRGIVCFGFPLHPAGKPATTRAEHLAQVQVPTLFLQGTRDDLADLALFEPIVEGLGPRFTLVTLEGADHGFAVRKADGRSAAAVLQDVARVTSAFCRR